MVYSSALYNTMLQYTHSMRVVIQGVVGSFHDEAAHQWFGDSITIVPATTFADVFAALKNGAADYAVVAVKNSTYGNIPESNDLLAASSHPILGEIILPIAQHLIAIPGASLDTIRAVYSHPVALPQCSTFLQTHLPRAAQIEYFDTAASVEFVKQQNNPRLGAIASRRAAELYNLPIVAENIQNDSTNTTCFIVLAAH